MNDKQRRSEVLSGALALLVMYLATAVVDYCLVLFMGVMTKQRWPGSKLVFPVVLYGPFIAMLYPGIRRFIDRRWMIGIVLIVAGCLLAWSIPWVVAAAIWMKPW